MSAPVGFAQQVPSTPPLAEVTLAPPPDRIIVTGMSPIPNVGPGAPRFTSDDLKQLSAEAEKQQKKSIRDLRSCDRSAAVFKPFEPGNPSMPNLLSGEREASRLVGHKAEQAEAVTLLAEASRRDAAVGKVGMDVVEARELERQKAVDELQKARAMLAEMQAMIGQYQHLREMRRPSIEWIDLQVGSMARRRDNVGIGIATPDRTTPLKVANISAQQHANKKGKDVVLVRGDIVNPGKAVDIPDLSVALIDEQGWVLVTRTVSPSRKRMSAGATMAFAIDDLPVMESTLRAVVTIAPRSAMNTRLNTACSRAFDLD
jgi:hypothetical protein